MPPPAPPAFGAAAGAVSGRSNTAQLVLSIALRFV
jgi:hypothetical protein